MIRKEREAIANRLILLAFPVVLLTGCSIEEIKSGGTDAAIEDKAVEINSACDFSNEETKEETSVDESVSKNIGEFLKLDGMTQTELDIEEFYAANEVDKLIDDYGSIEIVSSCYDEGAKLPLYTNNYWYSKDYTANKNEPGDSFIVKDNIKALMRPDYMCEDNKGESGIAIELNSSTDSKISNVVKNIYSNEEENGIKRCLQGNGEVYIEAEKVKEYPNEEALDNKDFQEKSRKWCMVFDADSKVLKRAVISSTNIFGGIIDTRYYETTLGSDMPEMYASLKKIIDDNTNVSDEDSRKVRLIYEPGTETKKEGEFKVKKGTNIIFGTSNDNLFLDDKGKVPYDSSDLTSDITVYKLKK